MIRRVELLSALIFLLGLGCLVVAGCGAMDEASGNKAGHVTISVTGSGVVEVGDTVTLTAVVSGTYYSAASHHWNPTDPAGLPVIFTKGDADGITISFKAASAGTYTVSCSVTLDGVGYQLTDTVYIQVTDPGAVTLTYTARIIPPASSELPPSEQTLKVSAVDQSHLTWTVGAGSKVTLTVRDSVNKALLPSYVRLLSIGDDPLPRDIYLGTGTSKVRVSGNFHALFTPVPSKTGAAMAPLLKPYIKGDTLSSSWDVAVDPGLQISGTVTAGGSALAGARVSLLSKVPAGINVPSTVGQVDKSGAYTVMARAGTVSVTVIPPAGSTLPPARMDKASLQLLGASTGWDFSYNSVDLVTVTGLATQSDGKTPAVGAQARFTLLSDAPSVGQLKIKGGSSYTASPLVRQTLVADTAGALGGSGGAVSLPRGKYQVELWPGTVAPSSEGYLVHSLDLTTGTTTRQLSLKLGRRAQVTGIVTDAEGKVLQAEVTASASGGSFQAVSGTDGKFSLDLDDGLDYRFVARALGSGVHAGSLVKAVIKIAGNRNLGTLTLPRAVVISGHIKTSGQAGLAGSRLRIWCSDSACPSKAILDETTTLSDGAFELRLPVPKK